MRRCAGRRCAGAPVDGGLFMGTLARSFKELEVYQASFSLQQDVFLLTKQWPPEERYALTDQIRRSVRSIGANLAESWAKRRYPAHFLSKLTDADGELQETLHWLDTAYACEYLIESEHSDAVARLQAIGRMLGGMISEHNSFTAH